MILLGYRHGLRASELCDLEWSQIELATGRLHVRRVKNGSPSVHPMRGDEMVRTTLYEAANVLLSRITRFSKLKRWGMDVAKRGGVQSGRRSPWLARSQ
jgi:integrase